MDRDTALAQLETYRKEESEYTDSLNNLRKRKNEIESLIRGKEIEAAISRSALQMWENYCRGEGFLQEPVPIPEEPRTDCSPPVFNYSDKKFVTDRRGTVRELGERADT